MCSIINAKSGRCSEIAKWCAQSAHYAAGVEVYGLVSQEECLRHAKANEEQGVARFSLVTSGRKPSNKEVEALCRHFTYLKEHSDIQLCASLELATEEQLTLLHEAGVVPLSCNLETAFSFRQSLFYSYTGRETGYHTSCPSYGDGCVLRRNYRNGETMRQRVEFAFTLKSLDIQSIPLNLMPANQGYSA